MRLSCLCNQHYRPIELGNELEFRVYDGPLQLSRPRKAKERRGGSGCRTQACSFQPAQTCIKHDNPPEGTGDPLLVLFGDSPEAFIKGTVVVVQPLTASLGIPHALRTGLWGKDAVWSWIGSKDPPHKVVSTKSSGVDVCCCHFRARR